MTTKPRGTQLRFVIDDGSKVGEARRAAQTLANFELNEELAGKVAIAATELANNLMNHATGGELLVQALGQDENTCLELLAIDRGPGMADIARCMTDGYSTHGTPGTGLGAVRRLSSEFDIASAPGEGTIVMARFGAKQSIRHGAINLKMEGEIDCGDAWSLVKLEDGLALMVIDGLGHGTFAAEAANACIESFLRSPGDAPKDVLQRVNRSMSRTRGGAGACALLRAGTMSYGGVGNITGYLISAGKSQGLMTHNGTLGMHQRLPQQFEYSVPQAALLVMHSDGISARWDIKNQPHLLAAHPALIAAKIYRDHGRDGRDDQTIVVVAT